MKKIVGTICALVCGISTISAYSMTLADRGKTDFVIVLDAEAAGPEKTAAQRLAFYLKEVTGADFPIVAEADLGEGAQRIFVGASKNVKAIASDVRWEKLGTDGIVIRTVGDDLILAGGWPRGTLYAVYTFLEDIVGCRWWSSNESSIPKKSTLKIDSLNITHVPPVKIREILYRDVFRSDEFEVQLKLNGNYNRIPAEYGGNIYFIPDLVHTFYKLLPPTKYFAQHPDWYSEINGKRSAGKESQLCLTNEDMRKEMTRVILEKLRKDPNAKLVSLSQNDSFAGNCQCSRCKSLDEKEGSPAGSLITFVNNVAEEIEKEFPDVMVETLAYNYSRPVPKNVRPRKNVIIRLVGGIGCNYDRPLDSGQSKSFSDTAKSWSAIAPNLFFWDYVTNFSNYLVPHPNLQVLAPNIRFFVRCNAKGIYEQGDSGSLSGDFVRLRAWLLAHLLWNPKLDENKLIKDFIDGYYGAAGPYISDYLDLVRKSFLKKNIRLSSSGSNLGYMNLSEMNQAVVLFDKAQEAVSKDAVLSKRVQRERLPLDHLWLLRYPYLKQQASMGKKEFLGPKDPVAACEAFIDSVKKGEDGHGGMYSESKQFRAYVPNLRKIVNAMSVKAKAPAECASLKADGWVDIQDYLFNLPGASIGADEQASDKSAACVHGVWGVMVPISGDLIEIWPGKWDVYISIRVEGKNDGQIAFDYGLYDYSTRSEPVINVRFDQIPDAKYHTYKVGRVKLNYNKCLWVSKLAAKDVYVDRIFLVPLRP